MGEITIRIPQKLNRTYEIESSKSANEILAELDSRAKKVETRNGTLRGNFRSLRSLMQRYRTSPDVETLESIRLADEARSKWER